MERFYRKAIVVLVLAVLLGTLTGCTNWKKKYMALDVTHQNLQGRYDNCESSLQNVATGNEQCNTALSEKDQTIQELERQISEMKISPGTVTGFGEGVDVDLDASAGTITVTLPNEILFSPGKAELKKSTLTELDHVLGVVRQRYSNKQIDIVGHTDSDPVLKSKKYWQDNWELSAQRALAVLRYFESHGVSKEMVRAVAAGQSRPAASNSTAGGKAKNRRVEVVVHMR